MTLTHDVDTEWILDPRRHDLLREIVTREESLGFRGAWYVTGNRLDRRRHRDALEFLLGNDQEIGSHGWKHDAKLGHLSRTRQVESMERVRKRFEGLPIAGFRAPWYSRSEQLASVLAGFFEYDSSVPNSSAYFSRGTGSGCCSAFPYRSSSGLVRLPMSLPPDTALERGGENTLIAAAGRIVEAGGVVVVTLHPQPHQSGNREGLEAYFAFLEALHSDQGRRLWSATPAEIVRRYTQALTPGR